MGTAKGAFAPLETPHFSSTSNKSSFCFIFFQEKDENRSFASFLLRKEELLKRRGHPRLLPFTP